MESNQISNVPNEEAVIEALTLTCEIDEYGTKIYCNKEGNLHKIYGPAIIWLDGDYEWYKNGKLHCDSGPAIFRRSGYKSYLRNGKYHRADGPAVIYPDGTVEYFINGASLTELQFKKWQKDNG